MALKTYRGSIRKQLNGDGRESSKRRTERDLGMREETKTKKKRAKKSEKKFLKMFYNS